MEATQLKQLQDEFGKLSTDFLGKVKVEADAIHAVRATIPNTEVFQKMGSRLDDLEVELKKARLMAVAQKGVEDENLDNVQPTGIESKRAYRKYIRRGVEKMDPAEVKLMTIADNTTGGFLAYPEIVHEIIKGIVLISPIRDLVRVRTTSARSVRIPKRTQTAAAVWQNGVGQSPELGPKSETQNPAYGMEEISNHELTAMADISNQDLEDSAFDLNQELQNEWSEQFAKAEGQGMLLGTSVGMPEGLLMNSAIPVDNSGSATGLTYDGLIAFIYNLQTFYAKEAMLILNRNSIGQTRRMVDTQGRPIWMPTFGAGLAGANPATIADIPYQEVPDMPNVAAGTTPIMIGAFKRGYILVDRLSIEVQRDPYTQNVKGVTRFIARKRLGGQVVLVEAFRKLQIHV